MRVSTPYLQMNQPISRVTWTASPHVHRGSAKPMASGKGGGHVVGGDCGSAKYKGTS